MSRFNKIELITEKDLEARFLSSLKQRKMPDYFLYLGEEGTKNWLNLEKSDDFPVASRLTKLLESNLQKIINSLPQTIDVVSIGVGEGAKEKLILKTMSESNRVRYIPVDISSPMVDEALKIASELKIQKTGIVAFFENLSYIKQYWRTPVLLCMLGNNICNYDPENLFYSICNELIEGDYFLFDCHLFAPRAEEIEQWRKSFEKAYHSDLNIRFNLWPLIKRGLNPNDCSFKLDLIQMDSLFGKTYRTEKHIKILKHTNITIGESKINFLSGDIIRMGFTYKYTASQIECYTQHYNFKIIKKFFSEDEENLLVLTQKT